jgi:hypothetical protein
VKSIADQLPPEIARRIHPDRHKNEAGYWAVRDQLLDQYRGQWIGFADGKVIVSGTSPVTVLHVAESTGLHPFSSSLGGKKSLATSAAQPLVTTPVKVKPNSLSGFSGVLCADHERKNR